MDILADVINWLGGLGRALYTFVVHVLSDIIHGNFRALADDYRKLKAALQVLFGPILKAIQWLRAHFFKYIYPWILKVQELLQRIRVILALLRIVGVNWAAKLDADLQKIQGYVTLALKDVVSTLNTVSTWVNVIVDPSQIIRRTFFTGTLFSTLGALKRATAFGGNRIMAASEMQSEANDQALIKGGAAVLTRNADGSVTYSDATRSMNDNFKTAWTDYGGKGF